MTKRERIVEFWATKKVTKPVNVNFKTRDGEKVSFSAKKEFTKPVKVKFKSTK